MTREEKIKKLLGNVEILLRKKPFFRGSTTFSVDDTNDGSSDEITKCRRAVLPRISKNIISQSRFALELDPMSHDVMFDTNLPSICVKMKDGSGYAEVEFKRMGVPFQKRILERQTLSLCGNPIQFTLRGTAPTEKDMVNFSIFKEKWSDRNQDGMLTKAVHTQLGYGDVGLLYYFNSYGEIKSRILSYEDGYVIISHSDDNGDRLMECVYYADAMGVEHIDCYDDTFLYRMDNVGEWSVKETIAHGFDEIPLATKRGDVAWNDVQTLIEAYEIIYNIFLVIQKRHGWGILYIKGKIDDTVKKIAGSIVLNDTSIDGNGSAEFKAPPSPQGVLETLESLKEQIQVGSSCTFILPKDIKTSGDISATAIMLTQSMDIEGATSKVIEWQNFLDKCKRLFAQGLAIELVNSGENRNAIVEFANLNIGGKFKVWRPFNETEYNNMLISLKGAGVISGKTAIEKSTIGQPDEEMRIKKEEEARALQQQMLLMAQNDKEGDDSENEEGNNDNKEDIDAE